MRRLGPRGIAELLSDEFREKNLLTYASAISFRLLFAAIPLLLFGFGLLGFLGLDEVWKNDIAPDVHSSVSPDVFRVINDTVEKVLGHGQIFWVTAGAALAVWDVSGAVRLSMGAMNRAYETEEERSVRERFLLSIWLAATAIVFVLLAMALVKLGPLVFDENTGPAHLLGAVSFVVRWGLAIALLMLTLGLLLRAGPDRERPIFWVSYGAALVVLCWVVTSLAFGLYLTEFADYGSLFGNLATVFIVFEYVWLSSIAFVTGILVDGLTRKRGS